METQKGNLPSFCAHFRPKIDLVFVAHGFPSETEKIEGLRSPFFSKFLFGRGIGRLMLDAEEHFTLWIDHRSPLNDPHLSGQIDS